jgi:hypothetical protein
VFLLGVWFAINASAWASVVPQIVTDGELPSASVLNGVQLVRNIILRTAIFSSFVVVVPALTPVLLLKEAGQRLLRGIDIVSDPSRATTGTHLAGCERNGKKGFGSLSSLLENHTALAFIDRQTKL